MTTLFAATLSGLGLSQSEAADFLEVRIDTVKSWSAGRNGVPAGVWTQLHGLAKMQDKAAREVASAAKQAVKAGAIELGLARDGKEARSLGWPSPGAQLAVFRRAWEVLGPEANLVVVPRGTTAATKAAIGVRQTRN